jgi:hypothetical protein
LDPETRHGCRVMFQAEFYITWLISPALPPQNTFKHVSFLNRTLCLLETTFASQSVERGPAELRVFHPTLKMGSSSGTDTATQDWFICGSEGEEGHKVSGSSFALSVYKTHAGQEQSFASPMQRTEEGSLHRMLEKIDMGQEQEIKNFIDQMNKESLSAPLLALHHQAQLVFQEGPFGAGDIFRALRSATPNVKGNILLVSDPPPLPLIPWNSCRAAATLIMMLAAPVERVPEVLKTHRHNYEGGTIPTLAEINKTSSASFAEAYKRAKSLALGKGTQTTVMGVTLTDVRMVELAKTGQSHQHSSFAHAFVVGIGPEGAIIWQSWGEHGYGLDEYIQRGGARLRTWEEMDTFVVDFQKLVTGKVGYTLFHLDKGILTRRNRVSGMRNATNYTRNVSKLMSIIFAAMEGYRSRSFLGSNLGSESLHSRMSRGSTSSSSLGTTNTRQKPNEDDSDFESLLVKSRAFGRRVSLRDTGSVCCWTV